MPTTSYGFLRNKKFLSIITALAVILLASGILALRNKAIFEIPNYYAEDATIFLDTILANPFTAPFTLFNGYLVFGQYMIMYAALIIDGVNGISIAGLPFFIAVMSTLFLGLAISLPFLLFRRELGGLPSILIVIFSALMPMANSSFAIIGTIGNLKFIFVYIAFLLVLYRNIHYTSAAKTIIVDATLLICVATNITVVFLLPFAFWPYREILLTALRKKTIVSALKNRAIASLIMLHILAALYSIAIYMHGIPSLPGYLDGPYHSAATLPLLDRSTFYTWLYPITDTFRARIVVGLAIVTALLLWRYGKKERYVIIFGLWAITLATVLFVMNRTGISEYFLDYKHRGGPDQFFYTQNLIVIFISFWLARNLINRRDMIGKGFIVAGATLYLLWAFPYGTTLNQARSIYSSIGTSEKNLQNACNKPGEDVVVPIYPSTAWKWTVERSEVCGDVEPK